MLRRFRNKLKTLSDQDFLDRLTHHDVYPRKYFAAMEQEARSRFFSNRHFNGENDEYVHPDTLQPTLTTRRNIVTGTIMIVGAAALTIVLLFALRTTDLSSLTTATTNRTNTSINKPASPSPDKNTIAAIDDDAETNTASELANTDLSDQPFSDEKSAASADAVSPTPAVISHKKYLTWEASYRPLYVIPEKKVVPAATAAETEAIIPDEIRDNQLLAQNSEPETESAAAIEAAPKVADQPKEEFAKPEPKLEKDIPVAEEKPNTADNPATAKEPISDYSTVSQLSVPLLRKFIPFINDWAYKQTLQPGIKDYYVENNSLVHLVLTREYSDSVAAFQQQKAAQMMTRYYSALKTSLGEDFPRVPIEIKFVKYNTDL
ncbi:MAG: hypothetical protein EOM83_00145 [Clostridia bacterium]|nr:hypothetical protein [Clostridia bacterium]